MFARLRGIAESAIPRVVDAVISAIGIGIYAKRQIKTYSGGNKRRLSLGIALVGMPDVLLLDEPTTGVDPRARRIIWNILSKARRQGTALVLTSHSMEECEALCTSIAIMVYGVFRCFGSVQHLKHRYGSGYTLLVRLKDKSSSPMLKQAIIQEFPGSTLKEEHLLQLNFELKRSQRTTWSSLFAKMEQLVEPLGIDDYSLSQTTLEQVFLEFTREAVQKAPQKQRLQKPADTIFKVQFKEVKLRIQNVAQNNKVLNAHVIHLLLSWPMYPLERRRQQHKVREQNDCCGKQNNMPGATDRLSRRRRDHAERGRRMTLVLYNNWKSSCSWRVRIALALKGIEYEYKPVNLAKKEQRSSEYLKINPQGLVPVLAVGKKHLAESIAIMEYLEEKFPEKRKLLPQNPEDRAKVRGLTLLVAANIQPLQNLKVREYYAKGDPAKLKEWAVHWVEGGFTALEAELLKYSGNGKFAYGDNPTFLDAVIPPQVYNAREKFGIDMSRFPTIQAVDGRLNEIKAVQSAHPKNQPDAPQRDH
uniref:maleylacetoacetate isomerase n=1 Tax=Steinernema glaseri TaxID=37863 RepID=A0A1I7ZZ26_9BILA